jgi:transposase
MPRAQRRRLRRHSLRSVFDALFYMLRTGCPWRYLPSNFPPWQIVYYHWHRFCRTSLWTCLYRALREAERRRVGRNPDPSAAIIDAQSVKTVEETGRIRGYDAHKCVKIVCTQMTKTDVLAGRRRREHLADLDIIVRDDHTVDEQFDQLALLLEGGLLQTALEALAHGFDRLREASQIPLLLRIGLQLVVLALHRLHLLLQGRSTPLVFGERHDPVEIGLCQAFDLAGEALPSLPQMGATRPAVPAAPTGRHGLALRRARCCAGAAAQRRGPARRPHPIAAPR